MVDIVEGEAQVPVYQEYMNPILACLRAVQGPMQIDSLNDAVAEGMGLSKVVLSVIHDPDKSELPEAYYRMAWARTYLKKVGLLDNPLRGSWEITDKGRESGDVDAREVSRQVRSGADSESLSAEVPEYVAEELLALYEKVREERQLPTGDDLDACYLRFRQKFGPEMLRQLDGEELLSTIHGRGTKDSLVYWLEFKDDEELPGVFGSISGGSALKFGIYQNVETGNWMTGHPTKQQRLSPAKAVEFVRGQRDQLVAGSEVLANFPEDADAGAYAALQEEMTKVAPDLAESAWGHKYFSLLNSRVLDDYHAVSYQKYHLYRLHKLPKDGRYENAFFFIGIARQLGIPVSHLGMIANRRHGSPRKYWRVGTKPGENGPSEWERMREGGFAAIGWSETGSIADVEQNVAGKAHVRSLVEEHFPGNASVVTRGANQIFHFATTAEVRDVVAAMDGGTVLGVGEVTGDYFYEPNDGPFAHRLPVKWLSTEEWRLPKPEGLRSTFRRLKKAPINLVELERHMSIPDRPPVVGNVPTLPPGTKKKTLFELTGVVAQVRSVLNRKSQVILYGPPGTGKTHWAEEAMRELAARSWFGSGYADLNESERNELDSDGAIERCCFHPAYGYEDFLIGYRPVVEKAEMAFRAESGVFVRLCERAVKQPNRSYYLLIDEINRGDIPRIFGELLMVLEKDKRGRSVTLPISSKTLVVPSNVHIIGTMNTADRSIALLDAALRRRFGFIELMPDSSVLGGASVAGLPLGPWLDELNRRILRWVGRDSRNLQIGHSYLLSGGAAIQGAGSFAEILRHDVIPLLQEYCYEDFEALEKILGRAIVRRDVQRIDEELFLPSRRDELIEALLTEFAEITATSAAVDADVAEDDDATEDDDDDDDDDGGSS
jgi:5-methylcytosine-specific restriction enzyme B